MNRAALGWILAAGGAFALAWTLMRPQAEPLPAMQAAAVAPPPVTPPLAERGAPAAVPAAPPAAAASMPAAVGLSRQVQQLVAAGTPAASFAAYQLLARCERARRVAEQLPQAMMPATRAWMVKEEKPATACGDLSPGQTASRLQYVELAAQADVPGAAMAFLTEGPYGDASLNETARPEHPAVHAWMQRSRAYVKQAADRGELQAIGNMSNYYQFTSPNPALALRYYAAQLALTQSRLDAQGRRMADQALQQLQQGLTPAVIEAEMQAGRALARR